MKTNFALSLSFDGLRLMHRVADGWHLVGQVALDNPDLTGALSNLRDAAETLEPSGISTKLLIPNDQIKYLALDTTRAEEADVWAALDGATPYAVEDLSFDYVKGGGRTYVAAVAKDTLSEAQQFASEHGFNPVGFAAVPEPFTYVGEAFFGATEGNTAERDAEPVIVTGQSDVVIAATAAPETSEVEAGDEDVPVEDEQPEVETLIEDAADTETVDVAEPVLEEPEPEEPVHDIFEDQTPADPEPEAAPEVEAPEAEAETPEVLVDEIAENVEAVSDEAQEEITQEITEDTPEEIPEEAPVFASRLRADRNDGHPAPQSATEAPAAPQRTEPVFSRTAPPPLAVPTGKGTDAMPPVSAPARDETMPPVQAPTPTLSANVPEPETAPAITGESSTALPVDAAVASASLMVEPDHVEDEVTEPSDGKGAAAAALGAAAAVGSTVGGMFASRRMARADAKAQAPEPKEAAPEEKSRLTVFGARKQPKPKPVVGGKPRFLGLILTAVLLLFLLAFAAFAAMSEDGIAGWFGFGSSDTQIAADPDTVDPSASEVAALQPDDADAAVNAPDALATPTPPSGGQVLSPEEATRIYAATGVWQRAPRIPLTPRTTSIDAMAVGTASQAVPRVPPSPLASASSVAGDALIATPIDPPAPDETFNFGADGVVVATPEGSATPDGIVVIAGRPALNPPTRPGTVAPEITPQDQLAAVIPDTAEPVEDAPDGVVIINGRPVIEPPVRTGTTAPAPAPTVAAVEDGTGPLVATDGLLVLAGTPTVLPPIRPGTVAPTATPVTPVEPETPVATAPETELTSPQPEGLNVIAGAPPILPPARPGTTAPQIDAAVETLSSEVAAALSTGTAQTPTADTPRPLVRPAAVTQAAAAVANAPVLGELTTAQASAFRPRTRPTGLAPEPQPDPETPAAPEPEVAVVPEDPAGLQISPEIAAAVQAAANRPDPIINATSQAVAVSERPDTRPRNMARIVERAAAAQERAATQVAAVPRAAAVAPSGPTSGSVAQNATLENAINLREVNLIGIYGGSSDRRALVRLANGRYVRVTVGDRLDSGRVTAISASALSYTKRGRAITLEVGG
ncbi:hypothetical protein Q4555_03250 [Octadecabacter sp. 1_MG-2023]|uniref:hypothetical protein n=1 Tax=unclassified Octadecabacter TaxID=196158 RepID=UPI001C081829|nr:MULTISPECIES: hypothetical protein [unclassified Octadecabacter]MBU2992881.1 hypothetical protein [Octadecabacter sp. B2R22]MDO6733668.1 hypothetical protein [Octadecabacter sp. 1_MG-2023]